MTGSEKLGIIAGTGDLPLLLAQSALDQGRSPVVIQITHPISKPLARVAPEIHSFGIGQIQKITQILLKSDVQELVIIGKVDQSLLFRPFRIDPTAIKILAATRNKGVHAILSAVMRHFESNGITVIEQHRFLKPLLPQAGVLTRKQPTPSQWNDLRYGMRLARQMANLGIGQTVVVKNLMPVAIEAIEGTDETIRRGGELGGKGIVVAKAAATHHDFRIDVPTVGQRTLEVLHSVRGSVLAVEARRAFVLNQRALCEQADRWKITIAVVE